MNLVKPEPGNKLMRLRIPSMEPVHVGTADAEGIIRRPDGNLKTKIQCKINSIELCLKRLTI